MIDPDTDEELSDQEEETGEEVVNGNREDPSNCQDVDRVSNASGSAIIKNQSRLSFDRGYCYALT